MVQWMGLLNAPGKSGKGEQILFKIPLHQAPPGGNWINEPFFCLPCHISQDSQ